VSAQPEARIVAAILTELGTMAHTWAFKVHGGPFQSAGVPDIIGCRYGSLFAIEVKVPGGKATRLQELVMQRISDAGGLTGIATSVEEALAIIK
jgi:hypothetical protein